MTARERYNQLVTDRRQFLDKAVDCSKLTLPYLIQDDTSSRPTHETLNIPWQSVGSKCVVGLAAKLMLAILPPQGTFFKFQVREDKLGEELPPEASQNWIFLYQRWSEWSWTISLLQMTELLYTKHLNI